MSKRVAESLGDRLRRANVANIVRRLKAGKTLSGVEQKALEEHESGLGAASTGKKLLRKIELAGRLNISRPTIDDYLRRPGAPKPKNKRYDPDEVRAFIEACTPTASLGEKKTEIIDLRRAILRMEAEEMEIDLGIKRGLYIRRDEISPVIGSFFTQHLADALLIFEQELPAKYAGRNQIECQQLNADGIDRLFAKAKAWQQTIAPAAS